MGKMEKAEEFLLKSLEFYKNLFGENHLDVAILFNNLSFYYELIKKPNLVIINAQKAYEIVLGLYGETYPTTIQFFEHFNNFLTNNE